MLAAACLSVSYCTTKTGRPANGIGEGQRHIAARAAVLTHMVLLSCLLLRGCVTQVRDKQDSLRACMEDLANLTDHYNSVRAAKEMAQKELAKIKRQVEEARHDWTRKIREHRAEVRCGVVTHRVLWTTARAGAGSALMLPKTSSVQYLCDSCGPRFRFKSNTCVAVYTLQVNELQRRQCKDHEKEVRKREKLQEKEKAERAAQAKLKMEEEAYALQVCWRMALLLASFQLCVPRNQA